MSPAAQRIDVHQHIVPAFYRDELAKVGIADAGGRALPDWSPQSALQLMDLLGTTTSIVSVSTPGTGFLTAPADAAGLARRLNDHCAALVSDHPGRFGFFAPSPCPTPMPRPPRPRAHWTSCAPTASPARQQPRDPTSARTARTHCGRNCTTAARWSSCTRPNCPLPQSTAFPPSPPTSCWTPPAPPTSWSATASLAATRTSGSSSAMPAASFPTPHTAWPSPSPTTRRAARSTYWTTSAPSTSTPRCPPACRAAHPARLRPFRTRALRQ